MLGELNGYSFTNLKNTFGTIHIVRDPRNLISSLKYHWSLKSDQNAMEKLFDIQNATGLKIETGKNYKDTKSLYPYRKYGHFNEKGNKFIIKKISDKFILH